MEKPFDAACDSRAAKYHAPCAIPHTFAMGERDLKLDFVKGFLVVVMVIYHAMNYFSTAGPEYYGYLRFVNGAFIFISGYVVAIFYAARGAKDPAAVSGRLVVRGLKLLIIFTVLNLFISVLGLTSYKNVEFGIDRFLDNLGVIYGTGNGRVMAFQILVPIAYVILISPLFVALPKWSRLPLISATGILAFTYSFLGIEAPNIYFVIVGVVGLCVGMLIVDREVPSIDSTIVLVIGIFVIGAAMNYLSGNALLYSVGLMVFLKLIYDGAGKLDLGGQASKLVILFGQYSLVCYIAQIVFLYGLYLVLSKQKWPLGYELVLIFLLTNAFLVALSLVIGYFRRRFQLADKVYKFVFA